MRVNLLIFILILLFHSTNSENTNKTFLKDIFQPISNVIVVPCEPGYTFVNGGCIKDY